MSQKAKDPEQWAKGLVETQGIVDAHRITNSYRQPMLGKDNTTENHFASWYERAYKWLQKNHPMPLID